MQQVSGASPTMTKVEEAFTLGRLTVNMAPMLCVLFIGARMRALQIDPKWGNPQRWAQDCFFMITYMMLLQVCLVIGLPLFTGAKVKKGMVEGDVTFEGISGMLGTVVEVLRYACLLCIYGGFTAV